MTASYTFICVLLYVWVRFFPGLLPLNFYNLIYMPDSPGVLNAIGAGFLHFGFMHLLGNMIYLVFFGRYVEDKMGPTLFSIIYLTSAGLGNFLQGLFNIHVLDQPMLGIVGASGAISGMLGAFTVRFLRAKMDLIYWAFFPLQAFVRAGRAQLPVIFAIALWFVMQIARGLVQLDGASVQVAYVTHLSGFAWGAVIALLAGQYRLGAIDSMLQKGDDYMKKGESYAAEGAYIHYLTHRPQAANVYASLARAMVISKNIHGAKKNYRAACQLLLDQGKRGEAEAIYTEAVTGYEEFTLDADYHLKLAFGLERNLKARAAITAYEAFEKRYPLHSEAAFALLRAGGLYKTSLDEPFRADACFERLVEKYPQDRWVDFAREQRRLLAWELG